MPDRDQFVSRLYWSEAVLPQIGAHTMKTRTDDWLSGIGPSRYRDGNESQRYASICEFQYYRTL